MIKTLAKSIREYKKDSIITPVLIAGEVIMECLLPFVMAKLIDGMEEGGMPFILKYGALLIALAMLSLMFGALAGITAATASCGFAKNLRKDLYYKVQDYAFADIDKFSTSSLVTRLTTDVANVQNAYQMIIRGAIRTPLMLIFSITMSLMINVKMSLIFLGILPVLAAALFGVFFVVHPIFKRIFKKYDALNNSVQENVAGIRVVKSFVREDYEKEKFGHASEEVRKDFTMAEKIIALNNPAMMICVYAAMFLVNFLGARMIVNSGATELTTGELSSLMNYGVQILTAMMIFSMMFVMCALASESASRICEVIEHDPSLPLKENGLTEVKDGSIVFENVSFKYSERSKRDALSNINLTIKSGSTVGIIGGTGSSKSSLIQLIPRLYDATAGKVLVGGVDVRDYDVHALRDAVSVVLQKNVLFAGTVSENLRWGNKEASDEELVRVSKLAQADEFVSTFADGYEYRIEQGGTNVSGGQKQRLCIARALLKKPRIIILDDSTSAVDTKTDALIRKALKTEIPDTTKIIIAQRLASVEDADVILVMDKGTIVEQGTHDELMSLGGIYREIYDSQTKAKEAS